MGIITYLDIVNKGSLVFVKEIFPLDKNILFMTQNVFFLNTKSAESSSVYY